MTGREPPRGWALLAEVLLLGVLVCLAALPVLTLLPALGAACTLLREYTETGAAPRARRFGALLWLGLRGAPGPLLAPVAVLALGALDALALLAGVPGGRVLGPVIGVLLLAVAVAGLRGAAAWRPGGSWAAALRQGGTRAARDLPGSAMVAAALLVAALVSAQDAVFLTVLPGLVVLALVAVEGRRPALSRPGG